VCLIAKNQGNGNRAEKCVTAEVADAFIAEEMKSVSLGAFCLADVCD